jgi:hypothetical protein
VVCVQVQVSAALTLRNKTSTYFLGEDCVDISSGLDAYTPFSINGVPQPTAQSMYRPETSVYSEHFTVFSSAMFGQQPWVVRLYNCVLINY